jgi:hypothetical protein
MFVTEHIIIILIIDIWGLSGHYHAVIWYTSTGT